MRFNLQRSELNKAKILKCHLSSRFDECETFTRHGNIIVIVVLCITTFRLPQIYEEFYHTINNADHEKDLKWWSNNHGVNMAMNWPQFEVKLLNACRVR